MEVGSVSRTWSENSVVSMRSCLSLQTPTSPAPKTIKISNGVKVMRWWEMPLVALGAGLGQSLDDEGGEAG